MVKTLLISPPLYRLQGKMQAAPPIGLLYISRYLNENGFRTKVYNADYESEFVFKESLTDHKKYLQNLNNPEFEAWKAVRKVIREQSPEIVGITATTSSYPSALNVARIVKQECSSTKVVLGGSHVTAMPEEAALEPCVDAVVIGEGEQTMLEIVQGRKYSDIKGLCFKQKKRVVKTGCRDLISDIDSLPFPMLEDVIFEKTKKRSFSEMLSSRGCPYNCIFCASALIWRRRLRLRSPKKIYEEMLFRKNKYGADDFSFGDEALTLGKERIFTVCKYIKLLNVSWDCQTRADHVSGDIIKVMKGSGCKEIALGVESGCQRILDAAKKDLKVEDVRRAARIIKDEGIDLTFFFIFGLPGETEQSIQDTFNLVKEIKPDNIVANIATPLPGTEFYEEALKNRWIIDKNWEDYYFLGKNDSVMNLPTIERKKVVNAYLKLQNMADDLRAHKIRKTFLNPSFILKNLTIQELTTPSELWRKVKIFYNAFRL